MNKALFYLIVTIVGLIIITAIWYPAIEQPADLETATPANGLVGNTTDEAVTEDNAMAPVEEESEPAMETPPAATAPAPAADEDMQPGTGGMDEETAPMDETTSPADNTTDMEQDENSTDGTATESTDEEDQ